MAKPSPFGTPGPASDSSARHWRRAGPTLALAIAAILIIYSETAWGMASAWRASNLYSHGFLVVPAALYLLWRRRQILAAVGPAPFALGLPALAGAAAIWFLGEASDTNLFKHLGLVLMIQAAILSLAGWRFSWVARYPLAYLFFAVPFGAALIPPLQDATAEIVTAWLQASAIPAHLAGHQIMTPAGGFIIAEACAGARFLISAVAVGVFAADLFYRRIWRKALLISLSLVLPIVGNAIRAYGIIVIAFHFGRESGVVVDHITYGLVFLSVLLLVLLGLGLTFRDSGDMEMLPLGPSMQAPAPAGSGRVIMLAALGLIVAAAPALLAGRTDRADRPVAARLAPLDLKPPPGWTRMAGRPFDWRPFVRNPDAEVMQSFTSTEADVTVYVAYFFSQRQGAEVVNEEHRLAGNLFSQAGPEIAHDLRIDDDRLAVPCRRVADDASPLLLCYWYWVDGTFTGNAIMAKLYQAKARLRGDRPGAAIMAAAIRDRHGPDDARAALQQFLTGLAPLNAALRQLASG